MGRATELAEVAEILRDPQGGVVLVAGNAGIGKSRLVAEALQDSTSPVVRVACWQGDGAPGFWPWTQVIRACVGFEAGGAWRDGMGSSVDEVFALLPGEGRPVPNVEASRFRLFDGVARLLQAVAAGQGLVLVFDDLQWVDEGSARLLGFAVRALQDHPVVFVGTYRDDEVGPGHPVSVLLAELAGRVRHVPLSGLDTDGLLSLAQAHLGNEGALATALVPDLHRLTGGNPFFAREVLALVRGGRGALRGLHVPAGVRAVIERRLARLSSGCDDALKVAAVIGASFSLDDLAAVMRREVAEVFDLLGEAVDAHVVELDHGTSGGRFAHDLLRETIHASLAPANLVALHARVADALESRAGAAPAAATLAHHLLRALPLVERVRAVEATMRAGNDALAVLANEEAVMWFERALSLARVDGVGETEAIGPLLALGDARLRASELPRARDAFVEAASIARRHGRSDDLATAALGLGAGLGGFEVSLFDHVQIELLEDAIRVVDAADSPARVRLLGRLSVALSFVAEDRRLDLSTEAVAMARRLGDDSALGYALAAHCDAISGPAHSEERRMAAAEVVAIGVGLGDRRLELLGRRLAIAALLELGEMAEVDVQIGLFSAAADAIREPLYRWYVPLWRGMRALMAGRTEQSAALCDEAEVLGAMADSVNATMLTLTQRWVRLRVEGRLVEAAELIDEKALEVFGDLVGNFAVSALSHFQLGQVERARTSLIELVQGLDRIPLDAEWLPTMAQLAELAVALGDRSSAVLLDEAMAPFDDRLVVEGIGAAVSGTLGAYRAPLLMLLGRAEEGRELAAVATAAGRRIGLVGSPKRTDPWVVVQAPPVLPQDRVGVVTREGGEWLLSFAGATGRVRDSKGLRDLVVLLVEPGTAVHVRELMSQDASGRAAVSSRGDEVLDRRAIAEFRRRLADLDDELAEAEEQHDEGRSGRLATEREFLLDELAGAAGLGGRSRRMGDDVDRARKAVRARVRDAIARVESVHPELGRHLVRAVKTGTYCSYDPEVPVEWTVRTTG